MRMMTNTTRWTLVVVIALALVALYIFARGLTHQRGDEIGARPPVQLAAAAAVF